MGTVLNFGHARIGDPLTGDPLPPVAVSSHYAQFRTAPEYVPINLLKPRLGEQTVAVLEYDGALRVYVRSRRRRRKG